VSPRRERPFPRAAWYAEDERTRRFRLSGQSVPRHLQLFCEGIETLRKYREFATDGLNRGPICPSVAGSEAAAP